MRLHETLGRFGDIVSSWAVVPYEIEGTSSRLKLTVHFKDGSNLHIREHIFECRHRKYEYHRQDSDQQLRMRWDNAPHWPTIHTHPHHKHVQTLDHVEASDATSPEEILYIIRENLSRR